MKITGKGVLVSVIIALATLLTMHRWRYFELQVQKALGRRANETEETSDRSSRGREIKRDSISDDLQKLSAGIRTRILKQQNPENCDKARLLIYHVNWWPCGLGCTTHVTLQHFFLALYTNRTFVLLSNGWGYSQKGWDQYFMPLGKCDFKGQVKSLPALSDKTSHIRIVRSPNMDLAKKYDWKIPRNILTKLKDLHSDPYAWWVGQFINYMLRLQPWIKKVLEDKSKLVPLTNSTVGLQIRWGDKVGREAAKYPVSEYMHFAKKWFERPEHQRSNKTVYVATEQSEAWKNLIDNYPDFDFAGGGYVDRNKELDYRKGYNYAQRKNELEAILTDIYFLSKCRYLVCTFSSNICRLLYEMMATHSNQPLKSIESLDVPFYWFMGHPKYLVTEDHVAIDKKESIDLKTGDVLEALRENFRDKHKADGCVRGTNTRTGQTGRVRLRKLKTVVQQLEFDL